MAGLMSFIKSPAALALLKTGEAVTGAAATNRREEAATLRQENASQDQWLRQLQTSKMNQQAQWDRQDETYARQQQDEEAKYKRRQAEEQAAAAKREAEAEKKQQAAQAVSVATVLADNTLNAITASLATGDEAGLKAANALFSNLEQTFETQRKAAAETGDTRAYAVVKKAYTDAQKAINELKTSLSDKKKTGEKEVLFETAADELMDRVESATPANPVSVETYEKFIIDKDKEFKDYAPWEESRKQLLALLKPVDQYGRKVDPDLSSVDRDKLAVIFKTMGTPLQDSQPAAAAPAGGVEPGMIYSTYEKYNSSAGGAARQRELLLNQRRQQFTGQQAMASPDTTTSAGATTGAGFVPKVEPVFTGGGSASPLAAFPPGKVAEARAAYQSVYGAEPTDEELAAKLREFQLKQ